MESIQSLHDSTTFFNVYNVEYKQEINEISIKFQSKFNNNIGEYN